MRKLISKWKEIGNSPFPENYENLDEKQKIEFISKLIEPDVTKDTWIIQLCNAIGCPVDSKQICIEPKYVAMNSTHVIIASDDVVYYWQYRSAHSKVQSLEQERKKKSGKENAFHIEELPNANGIYDRESW